MNIVAIGAHPDDVELTTIGTLLLARERADDVTIVTTTNGAAGASGGEDEDAGMTAVRAREAQAVADAIGARYVSLGLPDQFLEETREARLALCEILRAAKAELVLGPPPADYHADHIVTSTLVSHACLIASNASIETDSPVLARVPTVYHVEPAGGFEFAPTHYVDITRVFARKLELLRMHESQMGNMKIWAGYDLVELAEVVGAYRGFQSRVRYAEAFAPARAWPRVSAGSPFPS